MRKKYKSKLIGHGYRRAKNFLQDADDNVPPYFGLCNPHVLSGISQVSDADCGIAYLRSIASSLGLRSSDCIILCPHGGSRYESPDYYEYATAVPYEGFSNKRDSEGQRLREVMHARWYHMSPDTMKSRNGRIIEMYLKHRISQISEKTEQCIITEQPPDAKEPINHQGSFSPLRWKNPPRLFHPASSTQFTSASHSASQCFEQPTNEKLSQDDSLFSCCFHPLVGTWSFGLFIKSTDEGDNMASRYAMKLEKVFSDNIGPSAALQKLSWCRISKKVLSGYLRSITSEARPILDGPDVLLVAEKQVLSRTCMRSFYALYYASLIYDGLNGATISLQAVSKRLSNANWANEISGPPTRAQAFACITHLDSGTIDLLPEDMESALAVCIQNSIFVAAMVISDPLESTRGYDIRRLVGNINKHGICVLIAPQNPQIRPLQNDYSVVNHEPYDYKREDNFRDTTLHLSFTNWSMPLDTGGTRTIDKEVNIIESVITVRDRGIFVADLDILGIQHENLVKLSTDQECPGSHDHNEEYDYTSIDNWEELLDAPVSVGVFRAHGNWAARLAAVSILSHQGLDYCTGIFDKKNFCLKCLESRYQFSTDDMGEFESPIPSICID